MNNAVNAVAPSFLIGSSSFLQVTRTTVKFWISSNFGQIQISTAESHQEAFVFWIFFYLLEKYSECSYDMLALRWAIVALWATCPFFLAGGSWYLNCFGAVGRHCYVRVWFPFVFEEARGSFLSLFLCYAGPVVNVNSMMLVCVGLGDAFLIASHNIYDLMEKWWSLR